MQTPEAKAREDGAFAALIVAAREWAQHMDQWDKFKFKTEFGMVYVTVGRADQWPDDFVDVGEAGEAAQQKAIETAERAVINAALASIGPRCPYVELNHAVAELVLVSRSDWEASNAIG